MFYFCNMPASKALSVTDDILLLGKAPPSTGAIPFLHTRPLPVRKVIPEDPTSKVFNPPDNTPPLLRPTPISPAYSPGQAASCEKFNFNR